jgi:Fe-S-cluster formation regulator IscX/YfhJ
MFYQFLSLLSVCVQSTLVELHGSQCCKDGVYNVGVLRRYYLYKCCLLYYRSTPHDRERHFILPYYSTYFVCHSGVRIEGIWRSGIASALHAECPEFDPRYLHFIDLSISVISAKLFLPDFTEIQYRCLLLTEEDSKCTQNIVKINRQT